MEGFCTVLCLVSQSGPTFCDPMDCSLPGSSDHGDSPGKKTGVESKSGEKTYMCISLKKTYRWLTNTWKDAQHHLLVEKYKSKLQWDTTSHQSEWPWSKVYKQQTLERAWRKGSPLALLLGLQTDAATMEDGMEILKKLGIKPPYEPRIPLLGIYPEETKTDKDMCTPRFTAILFIIARTWKQPRCPSIDEWIKKLWYIYTMECYSAIKWNTFESVLMRWMNLEPIIQSEISQKEKYKHHILMHIYRI